MVFWSLPSLDESAEALPWYREPFLVVGVTLALPPRYLLDYLGQFLDPGFIGQDAFLFTLIGLEVLVIVWLVHSIAPTLSRVRSRME
jgi:hypothetical protein